jgi:peptide chain release factor 1
MLDDRIAALEAEFDAVEADLANPAVLSDSDRVRDLSRRHKELGEIVRVWHELTAARGDVATGREMLTEATGDDREMMRLEEKIQSLLLPKDPNVGRNVIMEIRGAVGGDEANLFARVLYDMYQRFAALEKWKIEILSEDASDRDGINEAVFLLKGPEAYIRLEHEAGTHRVQRVPVTEAKGRIHTSTATVTVLPEAAEVEIDIDPNDLKVDVYRSTGPGGQSVNTTDSAVRITHLPTGTVVAMQDEKSQIQNRAKAMVVLRARLLKAEQDRQAAAMSAQRKGQVGAGGRTDKIRTYNFKENRVTDHRINLTLYKLDQVLAGDLTELTDALMADKRARQLAGEDEGPP